MATREGGREGGREGKGTANLKGHVKNKGANQYHYLRAIINIRIPSPPLSQKNEAGASKCND